MQESACDIQQEQHNRARGVSGLANVMSTEAEEDEAREERQRTDSVDLVGFSKGFGFYWRQPSLFKVLSDLTSFQLNYTVYVPAESLWPHWK